MNSALVPYETQFFREAYPCIALHQTPENDEPVSRHFLQRRALEYQRLVFRRPHPGRTNVLCSIRTSAGHHANAN